MTSRYFGYNVPFLSGQTLMPFQADERLIRNDVIQLLLTGPGERVMRPGFGGPLRGLMFEGITPDELTDIADAIFDTISQNEQRVTISPGDVEVRQIDNNAINIKIRMGMSNRKDKTLEVEFGFNGSSGEVVPVLREE